MDDIESLFRHEDRVSRVRFYASQRTLDQLMALAEDNDEIRALMDFFYLAPEIDDKDLE